MDLFKITMYLDLSLFENKGAKCTSLFPDGLDA